VFAARGERAEFYRPRALSCVAFCYFQRDLCAKLLYARRLSCSPYITHVRRAKLFRVSRPETNFVALASCRSAPMLFCLCAARATANKVISSKTERRRRFGPGSKFISSQTRLFVRIFLNCLDEIRTAASVMQLLAVCWCVCFYKYTRLCVILFLRAARTSTPAPLSAGIIVICRGHISKQQKSFNNKTRAPQAATSTNPRI
jgi:hypothetical protein